MYIILALILVIIVGYFIYTNMGKENIKIHNDKIVEIGIEYNFLFDGGPFIIMNESMAMKWEGAKLASLLLGKFNGDYGLACNIKGEYEIIHKGNDAALSIQEPPIGFLVVNSDHSFFVGCYREWKDANVENFFIKNIPNKFVSDKNDFTLGVNEDLILQYAGDNYKSDSCEKLRFNLIHGQYKGSLNKFSQDGIIGDYIFFTK